MESIESMQARLAAYDRQNREATIDNAVVEAIKAADPNIAPTALNQVAVLLRGSVEVATLPDGKPVPVGPAGKPLNDFVKAKLESDEFRHFRGKPSAPAPGPHAGGVHLTRDERFALAIQRTLGPVNAAPYAPPEGAPRTLGAAIVAQAVANRNASPASLDQSQPFGLGPAI